MGSSHLLTTIRNNATTNIDMHLIFFIFFRFIYVFLERGEGKEKVRKRNIDQLPLTHPQPETWSATQACALIRNLTGDLWICRMTPNPLSHISQGCVHVILFSFLSKLNTMGILLLLPFAPFPSLEYKLHESRGLHHQTLASSWTPQFVLRKHLFGK